MNSGSVLINATDWTEGGRFVNNGCPPNARFVTVPRRDRSYYIFMVVYTSHSGTHRGSRVLRVGIFQRRQDYNLRLWCLELLRRDMTGHLFMLDLAIKVRGDVIVFFLSLRSAVQIPLRTLNVTVACPMCRRCICAAMETAVTQGAANRVDTGEIQVYAEFGVGRTLLWKK